MPTFIKIWSCLFAFLFIFGNSVVFADSAPKLELDLSGDENKATVFIVRKSRFKAGAAKFNIYVNDELIGIMNNGWFLKTKVLPGEHDLWSTWMGSIYSYKILNLEKGKKYFIEHYIVKLGQFGFKFIDEERATAMMKSIVANSDDDSDDS